MIGNGWYDPRIQYEAFYWFAVSPGNTYDLVPFDHSVQAAMYNNFYGPGNCQAQSIDCNMRGNNDESWVRAVRFLVRDMDDKRKANPRYGL